MRENQVVVLTANMIHIKWKSCSNMELGVARLCLALYLARQRGYVIE